jgi:hypothetical protein
MQGEKLGANHDHWICEAREADGGHDMETFAPLAVLSPGPRLAGTPSKGNKRGTTKIYTMIVNLVNSPRICPGRSIGMFCRDAI